MKVLGISGSPRTGGNTDTLLNKVLEGASSRGAKIEKIILNDLNISPCQEAEYENVNSEGLSVVDDDMQLIYKKIDEADVVILASPIFFGSLSAQTKAMIDRFQCVWLAKNILGKNLFSRRKKGIFLSVEGSERKDFFDNAKSITRHFFATINAHYEGEIFCSGVDKKGSVLDRPHILEEAHALGERIAMAS